MPEVAWTKEKRGWWRHTCVRAHTRTCTRTHNSILSLVAFLLRHKHTHWISSHSSWLKTPMAAAGGIHSPRMLGQLCWYWMRHSWSCLSLYAARDKKKTKKTTTTCYLIWSLYCRCQDTHSSSCLCPHFQRRDLNFRESGPADAPPPLCRQADNTGLIFMGL